MPKPKRKTAKNVKLMKVNLLFINDFLNVLAINTCTTYDKLKIEILLICKMINWFR